MLESLQSINTNWEEISQDPPSKGNPWPDSGNPNKLCLEETFNQNIPIHNMVNVPLLGGNQVQPSGNQLPPPPGALPPWLAQDVVAVPRQQHPLPKNVERVLPKFDPEWGDTADNHIHSFFLVVCMLGVADEDVVCHLFPLTLIGVASTCYFSLRIGSITSWVTFQEAFLYKFGDHETPVALVLELYHLKMEAKEKLKDFNIRLNTLFNRIPANARPTEEVLMELYITSLPIPTVMWVKRSNTKTLQRAIDEGDKSSQSSKKNNGSDNKVAEGKERDTTDVEGLHRIIKKLTKTVIDMKRNSGDSTGESGGEYNNKKSFKPFYRKKTEGGHGQLALPAPPHEGNLNTEELALIGSLLNQEELIVELEPEQENEEEYQVEEPLEEESQINLLCDFYTNENKDDEGDSMAEIHTNEIHT